MIIATLLSVITAMAATESPDSIRLHDVEVTATRVYSPRISSEGRVTLSANALTGAVHTLGEADALRLMQGVAGVTGAGSDYASGLSVDGADMSQTLYRMNRATVFFPYHFGGLFSTFTTTHFSEASLSKSIHRASAPNRLGGEFDFNTPGLPYDRAGGTLSLGLIAPTASVRLPVGRCASIAASGRVSLINELYPWLMTIDGTDTRYRLMDFNLTATVRLGGNDMLTVNGFRNDDNLRLVDFQGSSSTGLKWHNTVASATWRHGAADSDTYSAEHTAAITSSGSRMNMDMVGMATEVRSSVTQSSFEGRHQLLIEPRLTLAGGYEALLTRITPQSAARGTVPHTTAVEASLWGEALWRPSMPWSVSGGIRAIAYSAHGYRTVTADPRVTLSRRMGSTTLTAHIGRYHQFMHQMGFNDIGMASNFWLPASEQLAPQRSWNFVATASAPLPAALFVTIEAYYKAVTCHHEYTAAITDLSRPDFTATDHTDTSRGYNTGANATLRFTPSAAVAVSASYSYCLARRHTHGGEWFDAAGVLAHTGTLSAQWAPTPHWMLGAEANVASGRPVSRIEGMYLIANNVVIEYGERNAARMPLYHRLDLSATYTFVTGARRCRHYINVSVLNVLNHRNVEMQRLRFNPEEGTCGIHQMPSMIRLLPSFSYSVTF